MGVLYVLGLFRLVIGFEAWMVVQSLFNLTIALPYY